MLWPSLDHELDLAAAISVFPPVLCCAKNAHPDPAARGLIGKRELSSPALLFSLVLPASDTCQPHLVAQAVGAAREHLPVLSGGFVFPTALRAQDAAPGLSQAYI